MAGSDPSYTTCPLCWQSLNSSCVTLVEDDSPAGTDVQRMNSSKPESEKTNARLMVSFPVFLTLIQVSEGIKTIAPAWTSRSCVPSQTCALPFWINKISSWPRCLCLGMRPPAGTSSVPANIFCEPPFLRSILIVNGPVGTGVSLGLRTRCSPSAFLENQRRYPAISGRLRMCILQDDTTRTEEYACHA